MSVEVRGQLTTGRSLRPIDSPVTEIIVWVFRVDWMNMCIHREGFPCDYIWFILFVINECVKMEDAVYLLIQVGCVS